MKRQLFVALPLAALIVVLVGTTGHAQARDVLSVDIPFAFKIGDRLLPAGTYLVEVSRPSKEVTFQPFGSKKGGHERASGKILTRLGTPGGPKETLVFDKRADGNLLSEVWLAGEGYLVQGDYSDIDHQHRLVKGATKPVVVASAKR